MINIEKTTGGRVRITATQNDVLGGIYGKTNISAVAIRLSAGKDGFQNIVFINAPGIEVQANNENCQVQGVGYPTTAELYNALEQLLDEAASTNLAPEEPAK